MIALLHADKRRILRFDPDCDPDGNDMEFRLTYDGPLRASNTGDRDARPARKQHKHDIRRVFHTQLKALWEQTPFLKRGKGGGPVVQTVTDTGGVYFKPATTIEELSRKHAQFGFNFVPLVTEDLGLICGLDILYLRRSKPGKLMLPTGDIDNRLKTLFDALQVPDANQGYSELTPQEDEKPFYCLLENDALITKVAVETDRLLQNVSTSERDPENDARLVITVRLRPFEMHADNMRFG